SRPHLTINLDDDALINRAMNATNGAKFRKLWSGDSTGYASESEADLALCDLLAFWTACDRERMDRLFRASGLMREKWDERRGDRTYSERTIDTALSSCTGIYHGDNGHAGCDRVTGEVRHETDDSDRAEPTPYSFSPVVPSDHFISRWIEYAS